MMANSPSPSSQGYTVYVTNIPEELNEGGIRDIFGYYGTISSLFYRAGTNWAYIGYKSYLEAETAMKNLNNMPPLGLKLSLAKEKVRNDIKVPRVPDYVQNSEVPQSKSIFENCDITIQNESLTPCVVSPAQSTYNNDVSDASANALWARGQTTTANGKRHVSLGRGYTLYEIPNPHPQVETQINKICEKRYPGLYQYGQDILDRQVGTCARCGTIAKHKCQRCHEFYCSQECQIADWHKHKSECIPVPALVAVTDPLPMNSLKTEEKVPARRSSGIMMPLRPPKQLLQQNITPAKVDCEPANNMEQKEMEAAKLIPSFTNLNMRDRAPEQKKDISIEANTSHHDISIEKADKIDETIAFQRPEFLPKTKYTKVKIVVVERPGEYWVHKPASEVQLTNMLLNLHTEVENLPNVVPKVGHMYAAKYDECWYRCLVISLEPLKVHFVDYGNSTIVTNGEIRDCKSFKDIPYYCGKIKLLPNASDKYKHLAVDDELSVRTVSVDDHMMMTVEIEGETEKPAPISDKTSTSTVSRPTKSEPQATKPKQSISSLIEQAYSKLPKMISSLNAGDAAMIMYNDDESYSDGKTYSAHLALLSSKAEEFNKAMRDMAIDCEQRVSNDESPVDLAGVLICGKDKKAWVRGFALSDSVPCKMACIDYGKIITVEKVVICPVKYNQLPVAGVSCSEMPGQLQYMSVLSAKPKGDSKSLEVDFSGKKANLTAWNIPLPAAPAATPPVTAPVIPPATAPASNGPQFAKLKNNSKVHIVAYRNQCLMYLSSLEPNDVELNNATHQAVARCAQTAKPVNAPSLGQIVIARFKDGNWYRAIIRDISPEKVLVSYIDYGNADEVRPNELKELPHNVQTLPSCVAKVFLKDVPRDVPVLESVDNYIAELAAEEEPLTYTEDCGGVVLKTSTGKSVNERINQLLIPGWKKEEGQNDKTCYMCSDLKVIALGEKNDTVTVYVLQKQIDQLMLCIYKKDIISYIHDTLPKMIRQYCEANEHYIPRLEELCLVLHEGQWCRAACLSRNTHSNSCNVFMVDKGLIVDVKNENIRAMTKDFMTPLALACMPTVVNLAPQVDGEYSPEVQARLSELIIANQPIKAKILETCDDGSGTIELPEIKQKLLQENLIRG